MVSARYQLEELIAHRRLGAIDSLRLHWPEYLMEAGEVAIYLFLTCIFAGVLLNPSSPVSHLVTSAVGRRALMGLAIGATIVAIVMSPWGKQSGGHFNPAVTVAFCRLGKVRFPDTAFYLLAQFLGATVGVCIARYVLPGTISGRAVRYAVTVPGVGGSGMAFIAEVAISIVLMSTILVASNSEAFSRYTPYFVGVLYVTFITLEAPLSGMSMNPARSFAPALHASYWHALWLYFVAPIMGTLIAAEIFLRARGGVPPFCAKLHHAHNKRCIFCHETESHVAKPV